LPTISLDLGHWSSTHSPTKEGWLNLLHIPTLPTPTRPPHLLGRPWSTYNSLTFHKPPKNRKREELNAIIWYVELWSSRDNYLFSFFCLISSYLHVVHLEFILSCCFTFLIWFGCYSKHFNRYNCSIYAWASYLQFCVGFHGELYCCFYFRIFESCLNFYLVHMMCLSHLIFWIFKFCLVMWFQICQQILVVLFLIYLFLVLIWVFNLDSVLIWSFGAFFLLVWVHICVLDPYKFHHIHSIVFLKYLILFLIPDLESSVFNKFCSGCFVLWKLNTSKENYEILDFSDLKC